MRKYSQTLIRIRRFSIAPVASAQRRNQLNQSSKQDVHLISVDVALRKA
jgi:hypothetical protein